MKELMLLIPLGSALLLTGCAGTEGSVPAEGEMTP